jgi:hypothetical protein
MNELVLLHDSGPALEKYHAIVLLASRKKSKEIMLDTVLYLGNK